MFRLKSKPMKIDVVQQDDELSNAVVDTQISEMADHEENTFDLDTPKLEDEGEAHYVAAVPRIDFCESSLTYDNRQSPTATKKDFLSTSLHTTCSQESVDLLSLLPKSDSPINNDVQVSRNDLLSFHASQVDDSELNDLDSTASGIVNDLVQSIDLDHQGKESSAIHDIDVLVNVGNKLLKEEETVPEPNVKTENEKVKEAKPKIWRLKNCLCLLIALALLGTTMNSLPRASKRVEITNSVVEIEQVSVIVPSTVENSKEEEENLSTIIITNPVEQVEQVAEIVPSTVKNSKEEEENLSPISSPHSEAKNITLEEQCDVSVQVKEFKPKEKLPEKVANATALPAIWQMTFFGFVTVLTLRGVSKNTTAGSLEVGPAPVESNMENFRNDDFDLNNNAEEERNSLSAASETASIVTEAIDALHDFDLSKYEELKVVQLREMLRARKCNTSGKKHKLIHRLASVYKAELESLTVEQLRRIIKSKGRKQAGRKFDLIRKIVEDGL